MKISVIKRNGPFLGLVLFTLAALVLYRQLQTYHLHDILICGHGMPSGQIWTAVLLTICSHLVMTGYDLLALRYIRHPLALGKVVGIDITDYLKVLGQSGQTCLYPAADFESLSKFIPKSLGYSQYVQPILVGYSSVATLFYALICQAPAGTFKAALSLGFCPDLPLARAPCKGSGLTWQIAPEKEIYVFSPAEHLATPWTAFQGDSDRVCDARATQDFVSKLPGARIVMLPKVGHGFSVSKNGPPQFKETFARQTEKSAPTPSAALNDLSLVEVPARAVGRRQLAVMITGDGGWAGLDRQLADALAARGLPVVGLNSLKYFWSARTPDTAARDLERILRHYLQAWQKDQAVLIGYSLGADMLPFMVARLPEALRAKVELIALLGPAVRPPLNFISATGWAPATAPGNFPFCRRSKSCRNFERYASTASRRAKACAGICCPQR